MKTCRRILPFFLCFCFQIIWSQDTQVVAPRCNHLVNPIGIHIHPPLLSWSLLSEERDQSQAAYHILVATTPEKLNNEDSDVWNSGKVVSSQSVNVPYKGEKLRSGQRYHWKVRVWDKSGNVSAFSEPAFWETGLLQDEWTAAWITADSKESAPYFRRKFRVTDSVKRARLYISGLGYYEAHLNGERIGDAELDPAITRYDKRRLYSTYDVTELIRAGSENAIGVILGNGWYNQLSKTAWDFDQAPWTDSPALLTQLVIDYDNGESLIIKTDTTWRTSRGPIVFNDIHNGEHYDARLEMPGWNTASFDDAAWEGASIASPFTGKLVPQVMPPVRVTRVLKPVNIIRRGNVLLYDFGQNMSGRIRLTVKGTAGAQLMIRHGERVHSDSTLDIRELSRFIRTGEVQTERYTLRGDPKGETWSPRFTYHGFQFAEIILPRPDVTVTNVVAEVVHTDFETAGTFVTSDTLINRIHENFKWSFLSNFHGYPTDCPHREKIGWTGDAHLVVNGALQNFDAVTAYKKWLNDFVDEQQSSGQLPGIIPSSGWGYTLGTGEHAARGYGPQWEGAYLIIAWALYRHTGDTSIISRHYGNMKRYVDYLSSHAKGGLTGFGIDDHKQLRPETDGAYLSACFYYHTVRLITSMAGVVQNNNDQRRYAKSGDRIRRDFNAKYYDRSTGKYGGGSQGEMAVAFYVDLVPPGNYGKALGALRRSVENNNKRFQTGVVGTSCMIHTLMKEGYDDLLFRMIRHTDFPGWGYWIKLGATTLWQNWDGSQSRNHVMFGSVVDYFYEGLAGLRPDAAKPGFKRFVVRPSLNNTVNEVKLSRLTEYGTIGIHWTREGSRMMLKLEVPVNTTAQVHFPVNNVAAVREGNKTLQSVGGVKNINRKDNNVVAEIGSGSYFFEVNNLKLK